MIHAYVTIYVHTYTYSVHSYAYIHTLYTDLRNLKGIMNVKNALSISNSWTMKVVTITVKSNLK